MARLGLMAVMVGFAVALPGPPASAQSYIRYTVTAPAGCQGLVPNHSAIVAPREPPRWSGNCRNGLLQGNGELIFYRNGAVIGREVAQMDGGVRTGPNVSIDLNPDSRIYGSQTYSRWRNGFPYGEIRIVSSQGRILNVWEADGRGGIVQTMNPLNPLLGSMATAAQREYPGLGLFMYLFTPTGARPTAANVADCQSMMRSQGFTSDVSGFWCTGLPATAR